VLRAPLAQQQQQQKLQQAKLQQQRLAHQQTRASARAGKLHSQQAA